MNKKIIIWIAVSAPLTIGATLVVWTRLFVPDYPEGVLYDQVTYTIDPRTVLDSIDAGETDILLPAPSEPEGAWPIIWPTGSFVWSQEDYMDVVDVLQHAVWMEPLENWHLIRASFQISQCQDIYGRIDSASFSFFQRQEGWNEVHGFWINPMYGIVTAGNEYSHRKGWARKWETIDLDRIRINTVDSALRVAEENGGYDARLAEKNACHISVILGPDRLEHDLLSHPLSRYGWGWGVTYWSGAPNSEPLFSIVIDPHTGNHKINDAK